MPLDPPANDRPCLGQLHTAVVQELCRRPDVQALAARFDNPDEARDYIRSLPQRDDHGDPNDGPRIACDVSQRLRFAPSDPNCFERTALFLALVSLIDPSIRLTSASMLVDNGWHTFPIMYVDNIPHMVDLDPVHSPLRNSMMYTTWQALGLPPSAPRLIAPWFDGLARNACIDRGALDCYYTARATLRESLTTGTPLAYGEHVEYLLEICEPEAGTLWRAPGRKAFDRMAGSMRNLSISLDTGKVAEVLGQLLSTGKDIAPQAIRAALIAKFGPAAAFALEGANLAVASTKAGKTGKTTARSHKAAKRTRKRHERRAQLRRMTLGFR